MPGFAYNIAQIHTRRIFCASYGPTVGIDQHAMELVLGTTTGIYLLSWGISVGGALRITTTGVAAPAAGAAPQRFGDQFAPRVTVQTGTAAAPTSGDIFLISGMPITDVPLWVPPLANRRVLIVAGDTAAGSYLNIWWAEP